MDKPDVDFIEGLSPAVSIDQKSTNRNPRSTVGTITEVYDYLRLLYARAGVPHCPVCGHVIESRPRSRSSTRCSRWTRAPGSRSSRRWSAPARASSPTCSPAAEPGLRPRAGRRHGAPAGRPAQAEEAGEARHLRRRRPAVGQGERQAAAHRLGGDGAAAGRRPGGARLRRPARGRPAARAPLLRAHGLPQRPPHRRRRPRAAHVLLQLALRRLPGVLRHRRQEGGRPGAGGARPGRHAGGGAIAPWSSGQSPSTSGACWRGWAPRWASAPTPRGASSPPRSRRPCCTAAPSRCTCATATATAASAPTTPTSRASSRSSSAGSTRPSPTASASATRATCATCRARSARGRGCARRCWPSR
jgi:hypothetical protein